MINFNSGTNEITLKSLANLKSLRTLFSSERNLTEISKRKNIVMKLSI